MSRIFDAANTGNYRQTTANSPVFNWSRKYCHGCHKTRSVGQYKLGKDKCDQCARRES